MNIMVDAASDSGSYHVKKTKDKADGKDGNEKGMKRKKRRDLLLRDQTNGISLATESHFKQFEINIKQNYSY